MLRSSLAILSCAAALSAQVSMNFVGTVDISSCTNSANPEFIGINPACVAWDGTDLYIAGYNNQAGPGISGIVRLSNALTTPTFGTPFGVIAATPGQRGYTGLDINKLTGQLAAAHDFGSVSVDGIACYDLNGTQQWVKSARGGSGVGFDPGYFTVLDFGVAWTTFGSGRRALQDQATGADIYDTSATGGIILPTGSAGLFWRDVDFDPLTGDLWARKGNKVIGATRSGGNSFTPFTLVDTTQADFTNYQTIAFIRQGAEQFVIWNDRTGGAAGQVWTTVINCTRTSDGAPLTIDWGTFASANGAGAYDFSYDDDSGTLAISDFSNRLVHIFAVTAFKPFGTGCVGAGNFTPILEARGDARPNGALSFTISQGAGLSLGGFAFGAYQDNTPLPLPGNCPLHVTPLLFTEGLFFTGVGGDGSGTGSFTVPVPPGLSFQPLTVQGFILENGSLSGVRTTNGIELSLQ